MRKLCVFSEAWSVKSSNQNKHGLPRTHPHHTHTHTQRPSLPHLRSLSTALHDAINGLLVESANTSTTYFVDDPSVFNSLVISCIKSVPHSLSLLLPRPPATSRGRTPPPSTLKGWSKVKTTIKVYLSDLVRLLDSLKDASMRCALLKHIQSLSDYYLCFPKLVRQLQKLLVRCWSEGESHVQVMAFIVLRRLTMLQPHPALHHLLKVHTHTRTHTCTHTHTRTHAHTHTHTHTHVLNASSVD